MRTMMNTLYVNCHRQSREDAFLRFIGESPTMEQGLTDLI